MGVSRPTTFEFSDLGVGQLRFKKKLPMLQLWPVES